MRFRCILTLAAAAVLAWSGYSLLSGTLVREPADVAYTVVADRAPRNPLAQSNEVWISALLVEGEAMPLSTVPRTGAWEDLGWALVHKDDGQPARVQLHGREVSLCFVTSAWSGIANVDVGDAPIAAVDLYHATESETTHACLDLADGKPVSSQSGLRRTLVASVFIAPVLLLVLLWRPWRNSQSLETYAIVVVSLLHLMVWLTQGIGYNNDSPGYLGGIYELAEGSLGYFPPGYGLFLAPWVLLFSSHVGILASAIQHVAMVLSLVALQRVARLMLGPDLSYSLLLVGCLFPTLLLPQMILSENIAIFTMVGAVWLMTIRTPAGMARRDVIAGVFVGWSTLARVVPGVALALPVFMLAWTHSSFQEAVRRFARVFAVAVGIVLSVCAWNFLHGGAFNISFSSDVHLYNRVVAEQGLLNREGADTKTFFAKLGERPLRGVFHWDIRDALEKTGLSYEDASALMGGVAREGLRTDPVGLVRYSFAMAWRQYLAVPWLTLDAGGAYPIPDLDRPPLLAGGARAANWSTQIQNFYEAVWPWLLWVPLINLIAIWRFRERLALFGVLAMIAVYLAVGANLEAFTDRYVACVAPFALAMVPGLAVVWPFRSRGR